VQVPAAPALGARPLTGAPGAQCVSAELRLEVLRQRMGGVKDPALLARLRQREQECLSLARIKARARTRCICLWWIDLCLVLLNVDKVFLKALSVQSEGVGMACPGGRPACRPPLAKCSLNARRRLQETAKQCPACGMAIEKVRGAYTLSPPCRAPLAVLNSAAVDCRGRVPNQHLLWAGAADGRLQQGHVLLWRFLLLGARASCPHRLCSALCSCTGAAERPCSTLRRARAQRVILFSDIQLLRGRTLIAGRGRM